MYNCKADSRMYGNCNIFKNYVKMARYAAGSARAPRGSMMAPGGQLKTASSVLFTAYPITVKLYISRRRMQFGLFLAFFFQLWYTTINRETLSESAAFTALR